MILDVKISDLKTSLFKAEITRAASQLAPSRPTGAERHGHRPFRIRTPTPPATHTLHRSML